MSLLRYYRLLDSGLLAPTHLGGIRTVVANPVQTVASTVDLQDFGFEPNCGILVAMGRVNQGLDKLDICYSIGFWAGVSDRRVCVSRSDAGVTTMEEHFSHREDAVHQWLNTSTTSDGLWDVHSTYSDGVRFVTDEAYAFSPGPAVITTSFRATQAETGSFLEGDASMGCSFEPDMVFVLGTPTASAPPVIDTASGSWISYGWAHKAVGGGLTQFSAGGGGRDAVGTSVTGKRLSLGGDCIALWDNSTGLIDNVGAVTAMTGGVGLSWSGGGTGRYCHYLAIRGGVWHSQDVAQPSGTADVFSITGLSFAPDWAHGLHTRSLQATDVATAADFQYCHGHSARVQGSIGSIKTANMGVANYHNAATTNLSRQWGTSFLVGGLVTTPSGRNAVALNTFNADGVTLQNAGTNDSNRRFVILLAK